MTCTLWHGMLTQHSSALRGSIRYHRTRAWF